MARKETIISVFVASPSDVSEERNCLEEIIDELNLTWSKEIGLRLELVRWETHTHPGFGIDPQDVINEQIEDDYDIFIGILWYRYGTETNRADSGTIEEFQRAKKRFENNPSSIKLMIYFKDAHIPLPPSKIDYSQLEKLSKFKNSLGDEGGYYFTFSSCVDFKNLIRLHLSRCVQEYQKNDKLPKIIKTNTNQLASQTTSHEEEDDDDGMFELMDIIEEEVDLLSEITNRITEATMEIADKMEERTEEVNRFQSSGSETDIRGAKKIISKVAADMDQYVARMESELPLFSEHMKKYVDAATKFALLSLDFSFDGDFSEVKESLKNISDFRITLFEVIDQISSFQSAVESLPRMTSKLNRAKRSVVIVLQQLIEELQNGHNLTHEAEKILLNKLPQMEESFHFNNSTFEPGDRT